MRGKGDENSDSQESSKRVMVIMILFSLKMH